jgi:hypothetical protein
MNSSDEGVVKRHAAPNGAWLPGRNVAIDMALLTELAPRVPSAYNAATGQRRYAVGARTRAQTILGTSIQPSMCWQVRIQMASPTFSTR